MRKNPSIYFTHERPRTSMISLLAFHSAEDNSDSITVFDLLSLFHLNQNTMDTITHAFWLMNLFITTPIAMTAHIKADRKYLFTMTASEVVVNYSHHACARLFTANCGQER
jgi:hypothetical protein